MSTALDQALPTNLSERRQILRRLQRLKAVRVDPDADLQSPENWLFIRPMILTLVSPEWTEAFNQRIELAIEPDNEPYRHDKDVADVD